MLSDPTAKPEQDFKRRPNKWSQEEGHYVDLVTGTEESDENFLFTYSDSSGRRPLQEEPSR